MREVGVGASEGPRQNTQLPKMNSSVPKSRSHEQTVVDESLCAQERQHDWAACACVRPRFISFSLVFLRSDARWWFKHRETNLFKGTLKRNCIQQTAESGICALIPEHQLMMYPVTLCQVGLLTPCRLLLTLWSQTLCLSFVKLWIASFFSSWLDYKAGNMPQKLVYSTFNLINGKYIKTFAPLKHDINYDRSSILWHCGL